MPPKAKSAVTNRVVQVCRRSKPSKVSPLDTGAKKPNVRKMRAPVAAPVVTRIAESTVTLPNVSTTMGRTIFVNNDNDHIDDCVLSTFDDDVELDANIYSHEQQVVEGRMGLSRSQERAPAVSLVEPSVMPARSLYRDEGEWKF
jgi:hypothetical protein